MFLIEQLISKDTELVWVLRIKILDLHEELKLRENQQHLLLFRWFPLDFQAVSNIFIDICLLLF